MLQSRLVLHALAVIAMGGFVLLTPPGPQGLEATAASVTLAPPLASCTGCGICVHEPMECPSKALRDSYCGAGCGAGCVSHDLGCSVDAIGCDTEMSWACFNYPE